MKKSYYFTTDMILSVMPGCRLCECGKAEEATNVKQPECLNCGGG